MLKALRFAVTVSLAALAPLAASAGTTQIVVQWTQTIDVFHVQGVLDNYAERMGYESDGNDVGGGTENFYLYADDQVVDGVVRHLIAMRAQDLLPEDMRIGVAVYKDAARKDWTYRPAYPAALKKFNITY